MKYVVAGVFSVIAGVLIQGCAASNPYFDSSKPHHRPDGFVNSDGTIVSKPMSDLLRWYRERFGKDLPPPPGKFLASYADFPKRHSTKANFPSTRKPQPPGLDMPPSWFAQMVSPC